MQISILLMEQIFELFLMILMGFIIVKAGIVKEEDSKVLSKIVLYLIIPCVIINAFQVDYTKKTVNGLLIALAASVLLQVVLLLFVFVMGKLFSFDCTVSHKNQPSCHTVCRCSKDHAHCISRSHHPISIHRYTDVPGVRKRCTLCQRD